MGAKMKRTELMARVLRDIAEGERSRLAERTARIDRDVARRRATGEPPPEVAADIAAALERSGLGGTRRGQPTSRRRDQ